MSSIVAILSYILLFLITTYFILCTFIKNVLLLGLLGSELLEPIILHSHQLTNIHLLHHLILLYS